MGDPRTTRDLRAMDPADVVCAWEAVEELLAVVPDGSVKDVLRLVAAGLPNEEIAERLGLVEGEVDVLAARGRIRVLTAAVAAAGDASLAPRGPERSNSGWRLPGR